MARKPPEVPAAQLETIRNRLQLSQEAFSEALGFGASAYGEMRRRGTVTKTVALAAEALMRRQAPASEDELVFVTRIVKGAPLVTVLEGARSIVLDDQRYLLVPAEPPRMRPVRPETRPGNGVTEFDKPAADGNLAG